MENKYKCEMCDSESEGTPGTCCGKERKLTDSRMENEGHNHTEGEACGVCSAK